MGSVYKILDVSVELRPSPLNSITASLLREFSILKTETTPEIVVELTVDSSHLECRPVPLFKAKQRGERIIVQHAGYNGEIFPKKTPLLARFTIFSSHPALGGILNLLIPFVIPRKGGIMVHASSVDWKGRGLAFAGPMESGKSTIATILEENGVGQILNDDTNVIWMQASDGNGGPTIQGFPLMERKISDHRDTRIPLAAMFFIDPKNRGENRLKKLEKSEALAGLLKNTINIVPVLEGSKTVLDHAASVIERVPCYKLTFKKDHSIAHLVADEMVARKKL